eukprot:1318224-Amorphochlora_amoeboformis.AAC.1
MDPSRESGSSYLLFSFPDGPPSSVPAQVGVRQRARSYIRRSLPSNSQQSEPRDHRFWVRLRASSLLSGSRATPRLSRTRYVINEGGWVISDSGGQSVCFDKSSHLPYPQLAVACEFDKVYDAIVDRFENARSKQRVQRRYLIRRGFVG